MGKPLKVQLICESCGKERVVNKHTRNRQKCISCAKKGLQLSPKTQFKKGLTPSNKKLICEPIMALLYNQGMTAKEVGDILGLSKSSVLKRLNKLGVSMRKSSEMLRERNINRAPEQHPNWKGGAKTENLKIRQSKEYRDWRKSVFERDGYTCQFCNKSGGVLHADHIKQFAFYPELRLDINNGRTLCKDCHMKTPTYLNSKNILTTIGPS